MAESFVPRYYEIEQALRARSAGVLLRDPSLMEPEAARRTLLPAGHAEGFADTFRELYRAVYRDVAAGGPSEEPDYPTFAAGHEENVLGEAIARSAREGRWVEVTREAEVVR